MIGVGLRLVFNGGREAVTRLVVVAIAVGLGVGLLLTTLAATNAVAAWSPSRRCCSRMSRPGRSTRSPASW